MIPLSTVIDAVARNPWTALVLSPNGEVAELVPFDAEPTAQGFLTFARTIAPGRRFRFVERAQLGEAQLVALLAGTTTAAPRGRNVPVPGRAVHEFQSKCHPLARVRAIAEVVTSWIARRLP